MTIHDIDAAGNLTYDAVSRQKYEYNPVGKLQTLWNENTESSNMVAVCTYAWLEYTKPDNATDIRQLHREFPDYIDENGDIDVRYKVADPDTAHEYYYIPEKYPKLFDLEFIYSYSDYFGLRYEYMGVTPVTSVEVICDNYEYLNEKEWVYLRSIPSNSEALNNSYPQYFAPFSDAMLLMNWH